MLSIRLRQPSIPWPPVQSIMPSPMFERHIPPVTLGGIVDRVAVDREPRNPLLSMSARAKCMTPLSSQREKCLLGNKLQKAKNMISVAPDQILPGSGQCCRSRRAGARVSHLVLLKRFPQRGLKGIMMRVGTETKGSIEVVRVLTPDYASRWRERLPTRQSGSCRRAEMQIIAEQCAEKE